MTFHGSAEQAAAAIVAAFQNPDSLPAPLATVFVPAGPHTPCQKWSDRNRLLVALRGHRDARGFRQWLEVGRCVRKGEKSFPILVPLLRRVRGEASGEDREVVVGYKGAAVFGLSQTDGPPPSGTDPAADASWLDELPLVEVARGWGLRVETFPGIPGGPLGVYQRGKGIALGVKNVATWAHELVHAADDRLGALTEKGQHWRSETVAQLGATVLLTLLGEPVQADLGFTRDYIAGYAKDGGLDAATACCRVLDRTCRAIRHILDTAGLGRPIADEPAGTTTETAVG